MISEKEFDRLVSCYRQQSNNRIVKNTIKKKLESFRVHNAVIMAAGMSSRFAPLSYEKPKALLVVKNEVLIEREIRQLQEVGINEIYLVVGYMKEKLFYLAEKFGVHIIVNEDYYRYNNTSTLMRVKDCLSNTYICSSDNYFSENPFEEFVYKPYYSAVYADGKTDEYCLSYEDDGRISKVDIGGKNSWYMMGHVYFDKNFSEKFIAILQREYRSPSVREALWEDVYRNHLDSLNLYIRKYPAELIHEFDSLDELRAFDKGYIKNTDSNVFKNICRVLDCGEDEIHDIVPVKFGMTNLSFRFSCQGNLYIYRHPGPGTERYINRCSEAASTDVARKLGLDDTIIYIDAKEGWKLSHYIKDARQLDYTNKKQIRMALQALYKLHHSGERTEYSFNIWQEIEKFQESLTDCKRNDYEDIKIWHQRMAKLYRLVSNHGSEICLCHADSYNSNFLFDRNDKLYLIDWEYSGMSDPAIDIGTFITCADYTWKDVPILLELYLGYTPDSYELFHYTAYLAVCSYYWFLWALYQESHGRSVDQYMYTWYRNMKEYEKISKDIYLGELSDQNESY